MILTLPMTKTVLVRSLKNTLVKVRMTLRPGGYDDASQGWAGGYATQSETTGSVYLSAEFVEIYR